MNQEAWDSITAAMRILRTVWCDATVRQHEQDAARSAWLHLFDARNHLINGGHGVGLEEVLRAGQD